MYLEPHVASAFWFITGLIARDFARLHAFRAFNIFGLNSLIELAAFFDRTMVRSGSLLVFLFGLMLARLQRLPILGDFHRGNSNWVFASLILYLTVAAVIPIFFGKTGNSARSCKMRSLRGKSQLNYEMLSTRGLLRSVTFTNTQLLSSYLY